MAAIDELKRTWFVPLGQSAAIPPTARHPGSSVGPMSDGNRVTLLRDGLAYMCRWLLEAELLIAARAGEIYYSGFSLDDVKSCGISRPATDALEVLVRAQQAGVKVFVAITGQGVAANARIVTSLRSRGVASASLDFRFPIRGTNHAKYTCFIGGNRTAALVGSSDVAKARWDRDTHAIVDPERPDKATHDVGVLIEGPAATDVARSFVDRWNDPSRTLGLGLADNRPPAPIATVPAYRAGGGTQAVQVLHTYGRTFDGSGYSWAKHGEFTVWAAYLNAVRRARRYVYIEDQFFFPMWKLYPSRPELDIVYQLGEAMRLRGVRVAVLVPERSEESGSVAATQKTQRLIGIARLRAAAARAGQSRRFRVVSLGRSRPNGAADRKPAPIFVHSKLMLVDDELALIGSANLNQRSMTCDGELHVAIVDDRGSIEGMRRELWTEHLDDPFATIDDAGDAIERLFPGPGAAPRGRLRAYAEDLARSASLDRPPERAPFVEPYCGPDL
jgi:phosphatidylserine/phosphatidylglycerophosphate/cardiolipin synthase-like enzyme